MSSLTRALLDPWALRTAWRDLRRSRGRVAMLAAAMTLGIGALIAILSFGHELDAALDREAQALLGADLRIAARRPFDEATLEMVQSDLVEALGARIARRRSFTTMARFPEVDGTRMVRVRALDPRYPFHGKVETEPPDAAARFRGGRHALVDAAVLHQFGTQVGQTIRLGRYDYEVVGELVRIPGESATQSLIGPRVFVPYDEVDPDLLGKGSRVRYDLFAELPEGLDVEAWVSAHEQHAFDHDLDYITVGETRERWGRAGRDLEHSLSLVAFVAVLLGGLGVGSSLRVHLQPRRTTVAILRCLGASAAQSFAVFLWQGLLLAAAAVLGGALLAAAVQGVLPQLLAGFLPVQLEPRLSPAALAEGAGVGFLATLGFTLAPLLPLRRIPPRAALSPIEPSRGPDPALRILAVLGALAVAAFCALHSPSWTVTASFLGGLVVVGACLLLLASGVLRLARSPLGARLPFPERQALANLRRPGNQTRSTVLTLGVGVFLLVALQGAQDGVLREFERATSGDRANVVLFDIQADQEQQVEQLIEQRGHPILDRVPIISMRLEEIEGRSVAELRAAPREDRPPDWSLLRDYLCTARAQLDPVSERLIEGEFIGRVEPGTDPVPVSLEERIAERLEVGLGDEIVFDVAGRRLRTVVRSLREVEWRRARPNFFVVFPEGVLDGAPSFSAILTRTEDAAASAALQRAVVDAAPNVTVVDVQQLLDLVDELTEAFSLAVRFMAAFSIGAGVLVLLASAWNSRRHRMVEAALLRTLGASSGQIRRTLATEGLALGVTAAAAGSLLGLIAGALLGHFLFRARPELPWTPVVLATAVVGGLSWAIGAWTARGVGRQAPLETLREEDA